LYKRIIAKARKESISRNAGVSRHSGEEHEEDEDTSFILIEPRKLDGQQGTSQQEIQEDAAQENMRDAISVWLHVYAEKMRPQVIAKAAAAADELFLTWNVILDHRMRYDKVTGMAEPFPSAEERAYFCYRRAQLSSRRRHRLDMGL